MKLTLGDIANRFDLEIKGDSNVEICGIANVENADHGDLTFLFSTAYKRHLAKSKASAVVLQRGDSDGCHIPCLISDRPRMAWARIAGLFDPAPGPDNKHHPSAVVSEKAKIGSNVTLGAHVVVAPGATIGANSSIGPGSVIGENVSIGDGCTLHANVTVYYGVRIGDAVIIHSGVIIGADGFGFEPEAGKLIKIPQICSVVIGNDVEIGAGTTIDRGALNDTEIGDGVKLDNQVQVGHNTRIGAHTAISGCTAIAGSTRIGKYCLIGGAVGIIDNIEIADEVEITAMSLVSQSITEKGRYSSGTGLMPGNQWKRNIVGFKQLANLLTRVRKLERGDRGDK